MLSLPLTSCLLLARFNSDSAPPYDVLVTETVVYLRCHYGHERFSARGVVAYARHTYTNYEWVLRHSNRSNEMRDLLQVYYACLIIGHYRLDLPPLETVFGVGKDGKVVAPLFAGVADNALELERFIIAKAKGLA